MLNVGVIGCGNAGNQTVAEIASRYQDIPVLAINSSENDLATLQKDILKKTVGDGKGAGKNRAESKKFLAQRVSDLVHDDDVVDFMKGLDAVFIVSSTGGGTGSGMSLLLTKILTKGFPTVAPIPVGILPSLNEAQSTQSNALEYMSELYNLLDHPTYMMYDNEKGAGMPTGKMMQSVNAQIAEDINILRGFYNTATKYSSIDEKEAKILITTPGRIVVASLFNPNDRIVESRGVEDMLCDFIKSGGYHAPIQRDKIVNRTGLIVSICQDMVSEFDSSIPKVQALIGSPVDGFLHWVETDNRKMPSHVILIMSGLTKINDRIALINEHIKSIMDVQDRAEDDDELDADIIAEVASKRAYRETNTDKSETVDLKGMFEEFGIDLDSL